MRRRISQQPRWRRTLSLLDSTFIRSREEGERHLEVRVGNVETAGGGRHVFGAVAKADTDITVLIRRNLETVGRTANTEVTAFTDGCPGLRCILANAGVTRSHRFSIGSTSVNAGQDPYKYAGANNLGTRFARAACRRRMHWGKRAGSPTLSNPCRRGRWPSARLHNVGDPAKIGHHGRPLL